MSWCKEDKSLKWIKLDTVEEENKKLKAYIQELEAKKALDKACADEQFDTIQELKAENAKLRELL